MSNDSNSKKYDLEERTARFGEDITNFSRKMPHNPVPSLKNEAQPHWQEAKELNLIFNSIYKKVK